MKSQIKIHLNNIITDLKKTNDVIAIYLFGSYARNTNTAKSDVDICVITRDGISGESESEMGSAYSEDIDLVLLKNLPLPLKFRVFQEGQEIFVRNEFELSRVKSKVIKEYLDYEPVLKRLSASVLATG